MPNRVKPHTFNSEMKERVHSENDFLAPLKSIALIRGEAVIANLPALRAFASRQCLRARMLFNCQDCGVDD